MTVSTIKSYTDSLAPGFFPSTRDTWISDTAYTEVVGKMPIPCADTLIKLIGDDQALYLGKRIVYPMKGIWCIGGRLFFNDRTLEEAIARAVEYETGCRIAPDRFTYLRTNYYSWVKIAQGDMPGKNLAPLYVLEVTRDELDRMSAGIKPTEYDSDFGLQRFCRQRLIDEHVHEAMLDAFDQLFPS